jgi:hypothetical protein
MASPVAASALPAPERGALATRANDVASTLLDRARAHDFAGFDPFDGLNSRLFAALPLRHSELCRLAWLQLHKRLPLNLRPLVGVPRARNAKGVALFVSGLLERHAAGDRAALAEAIGLGHWLLGARCDAVRWGPASWGYHFAWQARAFHVPRGTPNAISTVYVAGALHALGAASGRADFTAAAVDAGVFIDRVLHTPAPGGAFYAYIPGEGAFVHNASLWAAAAVARSARALADGAMLARALACAEVSMAAQREDGAWRYGTRAHHAFVDGFHTGYNLEALQAIESLCPDPRRARAIARGLDYFRARLLDADGTARYYDTTPWPLDTHAAAQAVLTLLRAGAGAPDVDAAARVVQRMLDVLYLQRHGRFVYQRHRWYVNRVDYLRWTQAWAFLALAAFARAAGVTTGRDT